MRASLRDRFRPGSRSVAFLFVVLMLLPVGLATARSFVTLIGPSPATGHAQVITQGIATLPSDGYVMRVVQRIAPVRGDAKIGTRALGFALATDEPILITDVSGPDDDQFIDRARLAPGEAYMTLAGTRQIRASLSDTPTNYIGIEFVPIDQVNDVGTGTLLFASDPLSTPSGQRDVDMVRNVLANDEQASLADSDGDVLLLATDGAIDILPGRSRRTHLDAGQAAIFSAEDLDDSGV